MPGLGKSTLARALAAPLASAGRAVLILPEAVPYAVQVRDIALLDLEPFLDEVNAQAEILASAFVRAYAARDTPKDPGPIAPADTEVHARRPAPASGSGAPGSAMPSPRPRGPVVLRDPAHQQNESYRFVLHALREPDAPVARVLAALGAGVAAGVWDDGLATTVGQLLWERHAPLRTPPSGE